MRLFADNLAGLPGADHLAFIEVTGPDDVLSRIENKPGSQGSLRLYRFLFEKYGEIDAVAAEAGLALYAEHVAEAREHPGRHPNIDRLIGIVACKPALAVRLLREED